MSIKNFESFRIGNALVVRNALDAMVIDGHNVGWFAQFTFPKPYLTNKCVIGCKAWTTFCSHGKNGWRRIIKNHPYVYSDLTLVAYPPTQGRVEPNQFAHGRRIDTWRWTTYHKNTGRVIKNATFARETFYNNVSFDVYDMIAMVNGVNLDPSGGHALFDKLADTEEFGSLLTGPRWLPKTWDEMLAARDEQEKKEEEDRRR